VVVEGCGQNGDERRWESSGGRSLYIGMKIHKNSLRMSPPTFCLHQHFSQFIKVLI
jgi:hypothetical protein